jgi:membrane protein implicated in regulation of membrane protease activity
MESLGDMLFPLSHWSWWIIAAVLVILEVAAPGVFFLWLGVAAAVVGALIYFVPDLNWKLQLGMFAVLSVISVVASRRYLRGHPLETDRPMLNRRGQSYIGQAFTLEQPIKDGHGHLHIGDSRWRIAGEDMPAGTKVRVVSSKGVTLNVEPVAPNGE